MKENVNIKKPLVSIIMAAYNAENYIAEAISSVLEQTYQNWELIIVNDGSTDKTRQIINSFVCDDERILVIDQKNSGRPAIARNVGIRCMNGDFVVFLDADDTYEKNKISAQLQQFKTFPKLDIIFHDIGIMNECGVKAEKSYLESVDYMQKVAAYIQCVKDDVFLCNKQFYNFMSTTITSLSMCAVMVRREALFKQKVWFEEDFVIGEDIDLWFRLVKGKEVIFINQILSYYRQHDSSITQDDEKSLIGSIYSHTKNLERGRSVFSVEETEVYSERIAQNHMHLAHQYFEKFKMKESRRHLLMARVLSQNVQIVFPLIKSFVPKFIIHLYKKN